MAAPDTAATPPLTGRTVGAHDVLHLQRTVGNAAVQRLLIQRMTIGGKHYPPTGKDAKALWERIRVEMINNALSPHGARKEFLRILGSNAADPGSEDKFVQHFLQHAVTEAKAAAVPKKKGEDRPRSWTRFLQLNRPTWPKSYATVKGNEIRHVVRNAAIKNALLRDFEFHQAEGAQRLVRFERDFAKVIQRLGIGKQTTPFELVKQIYTGLYLHPKNLFPGSGAVNEVIGLSADKIDAIGDRLDVDGVATADEVTEEVQNVWEEAASAEQTALAKLGRMGAEAQATFTKGLDAFFDILDTFLRDVEKDWLQSPPSKRTMAMTFHDIADNFSFDFILPESGISSGAIKQRQAVLVEVNTKLNAHKVGDTAELGNIFDLFLSPVA